MSNYQFRLIGYFGLVFSLWLTPDFINQNINQVLAQDIAAVDAHARVKQPRQLLDKGIRLYEQQFFASARDIWLQSASLYAQQQDTLGEAFAFNNIALAHQQLGETKQAQQAIARSFDLLQEEENLVDKPGYWEILAKVHNTQGNWQFQQGQMELALDSWQDATQYYLRSQNKSGAMMAQINQGKAWQSLGFTLKALNILETVQDDLQAESNLQLKATGLRHLGISLRNLGELEQSALVLKQSVDFAQQPQSLSLGWLELGNTQRQQGERAWEIGKSTPAQKYFQQGIKSYKQAAKFDSDLLPAALNQFSLLVDLGKDQAAAAFVSRFQFPSELNPSRHNIYALLNYARSLTCLSSSPRDIPLCPKRNKIEKSSSLQDFDAIITTINQAIALARKIQDPLVEAQGITQLAEVYELQENYPFAQDLNQRALLLLEGKSAVDIVYRLEWQLGRIYKQQGNIDAATIAYSQAIASLEKVRANILFVDPQIQFSFRDRLEPVYREYADLLLRTENGKSPSQRNLTQAVRAINALQIAELEDFLGCDLSRLVQLDQTTVDKTAVQIYPIVLRDRLVTIIDLPDKPLIYQATKVARSQVEQTINALQINLNQPGKTPEVLQHGQQIYQWLIKPVESILVANSAIKTLVFVPDTLLRNIPFGVLYDGEKYLIEKDYAVAVSPQLELFAPSISTAPLKVLTGGVGIAQTIEGIGFPAIAQVEQELTQIAARVQTNSPLLNEAFTEVNIEQELQQGNFSAIHWKTHGVFSSDPTATFLVAYQDSIKASELQSLVQTASNRRQEPLELLVLSACETAKGDNRAILGLAGLTVRTGARTALSTLWGADDRATTLLMTKFYQQLASGSTKAEALRQAQLSLIEAEGYLAPYYWGTYILVGNWL